jgi:predicted transcriptional regulator
MKKECLMEIKLFESELKVMEVLWQAGDQPAGQIAKVLAADTGWNRNTTYTVIKKCVEKGAILRSEPNFMCHALIGREEVQRKEAEELKNRMFAGSTEQMFAAMVGGKKLKPEEITRLRLMIEELDK